MLGRGGGNGAMNGHGNGIGLGDGLAAQLLSVSAFKPIIDKILAEGGFAAGPDALTSLTNALAAQQLASPAEPPAIEEMDDADERGDAAHHHLGHGQGDARTEDLISRDAGLLTPSS